jgi:pantoate--beta-alanine ligase
MKILLNNVDLNEALSGVSDLGFVPTMGSLHNGHISLIKKSKKQCKKTIVSIFVNPSQFNKKKDFIKYPRNNKKDILILKKLNVDFLYMPKINQVYSSIQRKKIVLLNKNKILCAKFRKGHFEGVLDIMDRLTSLIKPKKIFMGEKDYQQLHLVKNFIEKKYSSKIISCKTIRDKNKLALSSRNLLLKEKELIIAGKIAQSLFNLKKLLKNKNNIKDIIDTIKNDLMNFYSIKIEYLELRNKKNLTISEKIKNSKIFIAYYLNKIRLIDNF